MTGEECPICGIKVKETNMPNHLRKVHPNSETARMHARTVEKGLQKRSPRTPITPGAKRLVLAAVLVSLIIVSAGLLYTWYVGQDHPRIEVDPSSYDFGDIPHGISVASFQIWNAGEANLELTGASTSCGCTSAVFKVGSVTSPTFGMHNNPKGWSATLLPGEAATLEVSYDSSLHPDSGHIQRAVYVKSNDPFTPELQIDLTAYVIP